MPPSRRCVPTASIWDLAPHGARAFVVASLLDGTETPALDRQTLYERTVYLVKAVVLTSGGTVTRDAAARIHELLQHAELDLTAAGYAAMVLPAPRAGALHRNRPGREVRPLAAPRRAVRTVELSRRLGGPRWHDDMAVKGK